MVGLLLLDTSEVPSHIPAREERMATSFRGGPTGRFWPTTQRVANSTKEAVTAGDGAEDVEGEEDGNLPQVELEVRDDGEVDGPWPARWW